MKQLRIYGRAILKLNYVSVMHFMTLPLETDNTYASRNAKSDSVLISTVINLAAAKYMIFHTNISKHLY